MLVCHHITYLKILLKLQRFQWRNPICWDEVLSKKWKGSEKTSTAHLTVRKKNDFESYVRLWYCILCISLNWTRAPTVVLSFTGYSVGTIRSVLSLVYWKGMSKINQGVHMKKVLKEVVYYSNHSDPPWCFVHLYKEYLSPWSTRLARFSILLTLLKVPKDEIWFLRGHTYLRRQCSDWCMLQYDDYYINHSLHVLASALTNVEF